MRNNQLRRVPLTPFVLASLVDAWIDARDQLSYEIEHFAPKQVYDDAVSREALRAAGVQCVILSRVRNGAWPGLLFWTE